MSYLVAGCGIIGVNAIRIKGYFSYFIKLFVAMKDGILALSQEVQSGKSAFVANLAITQVIKS